MEKAAKPAWIYQLKIILMDINPVIWRRVLVPADITLDRLHLVIQTTMDWYDCPRHEFHTDDEKHYGVPVSDDLHDVEDETAVRLNQIVTGQVHSSMTMITTAEMIGGTRLCLRKFYSPRPPCSTRCALPERAPVRPRTAADPKATRIYSKRCPNLSTKTTKTNSNGSAENLMRRSSI